VADVRVRLTPRAARPAVELLEDGSLAVRVSAPPVDGEANAALVKAGLVRQTVAMRAMQVLESVRPYITSHGGDVELVAIEDGVARVRLSGNCQGCGSSSVTMHQVIRDAMLEHVPEIHAVEDAGPPVLAPLGGAAIALPMAQVPGRAPAA